MKLNIGCNGDGWGDVRLDLSPAYLGKKSKANIFGDAQKLPFRDLVFHETKAHHVLEHLPNWQFAIYEWCRITESKLEIEVPSDPGYFKTEIFAEIFSLSLYFIYKLPRRRRAHLWKFTPNAIMKELKKHSFNCELQIIKSPLILRDPNSIGKNSIAEKIRQKQKKFLFAYRVVAQRS